MVNTIFKEEFISLAPPEHQFKILQGQLNFPARLLGLPLKPSLIIAHMSNKVFTNCSTSDLCYFCVTFEGFPCPVFICTFDHQNSTQSTEYFADYL